MSARPQYPSISHLSTTIARAGIKPACRSLSVAEQFKSIHFESQPTASEPNQTSSSGGTPANDYSGFVLQLLTGKPKSPDHISSAELNAGYTSDFFYEEHGCIGPCSTQAFLSWLVTGRVMT